MTPEWKYQLVAFNTIFIREVRRFMRIWPQTLLPPVITMALYFIIFGSVIGSRIGDMAGFDYMTFVVPGLAMMAVITNSFTNVVSSFFSGKFQRSVEELLVSPVSDSIVLLGYVLGGAVRGLIVGVLVMFMGAFFVDLKIYNLPVTLLAVFMTAVLFSLGGFINAIYAKKFDDISIIPTFVLMPMTYLGGVFYSVDVLPEPWRSMSMLNPILYQVNAFRFGILGEDGGVNVTLAFVVMGLAIGVFSVWALWLLRTGKGLRT